MIAAAISVALKDAAYAVDWVEDGTAASNVLDNGEHQAVLLDLGLPKRDGVEVLRRLRQSGNTVPVIVITARDGMEDRIKGLDFGADDYLVKPFDVNELLARLRAVIRRQGGQAAPVLSNGVVSLDPATRMAQRGSAAHVLSAREFALLHALILTPARFSPAPNWKSVSTAGTRKWRATPWISLSTAYAKNLVPTSLRTCAVRAGWWPVKETRQNET